MEELIGTLLNEKRLTISGERPSSRRHCSFVPLPEANLPDSGLSGRSRRPGAALTQATHPVIHVRSSEGTFGPWRTILSEPSWSCTNQAEGARRRELETGGLPMMTCSISSAAI